VDLQPLACWDCGFESRRGHGCLYVVSVVCLSGRGLCDGLITRPEESYRLCCESQLKKKKNKMMYKMLTKCAISRELLQILKTHTWIREGTDIKNWVVLERNNPSNPSKNLYRFFFRYILCITGRDFYLKQIQDCRSSPYVFYHNICEIKKKIFYIFFIESLHAREGSM
jgi:hypothetical protein